MIFDNLYSSGLVMFRISINGIQMKSFLDKINLITYEMKRCGAQAKLITFGQQSYLLLRSDDH